MSTPDNPVIDVAHGREDQYIEAVALAKQKASVSFLQRKLLISYHHAEDLLERMISDGHITDYSGRCLEKVQARQIIQLRARISELEGKHARKYRLLQRGEAMCLGDQFIDDDTVTWHPVWKGLVLAGACWLPCYQPMRREIQEQPNGPTI